MYFYGWLRHLVFLGFVSWVSLILCFADSFCFVKSVPAGIPELGAYSYSHFFVSLFLCLADFYICFLRSSAWLLFLQ